MNGANDVCCVDSCNLPSNYMMGIKCVPVRGDFPVCSLHAHPILDVIGSADIRVREIVRDHQTITGMPDITVEELLEDL